MTDVEIQAQKWRDESPFLIQRDLGLRLGVSSHVVGRLLDQCGLREGKQPTSEAVKRKLAETDRSGPWPQFKWNERQIVPLLREMLSKTRTE